MNRPNAMMIQRLGLTGLEFNAVQQRTIGTFEVFDKSFAVTEPDAGVVATDFDMGQDDVISLASSDDERFLTQGKFLAE